MLRVAVVQKRSVKLNKCKFAPHFLSSPYDDSMILPDLIIHFFQNKLFIALVQMVKNKI